VLATACAHTLDEVDPEPFPPHCLMGTKGQERIPQTAWPGSLVLGPSDSLPEHAPLPLHLTLEKTRYDLFSRNDAASIVARYRTAGTLPRFFVYGVATDFCVRAAVLGFRHLGYPVTVIVDAVWAIDTDAEPAELARFVSNGADLALTDVVLEELAR
jgi:nicotinamidase/pyrazinamidase